MKTAIVYYSQSGNVDFVANEIAKHLDADIVRIEPEKSYPTKGLKKFLWGGKSAVMGDEPTLVPYEFNADDYDVVLLGYPVWAGTFAPPIRSFVSQTKDALKTKRVGAFACSSGGHAEKSFDKLQSFLNVERLFPTLSLVDPHTKQTDDNIAQIEAFCTQIDDIKA